MKRTEKLKRYCIGRQKGYVAKKELGIPAPFMSFLLRYDLDQLIARIDALPLEERKRRRAA